MILSNTDILEDQPTISKHTIPGKLRHSKIQHWRKPCNSVPSSVKCQSDESVNDILHISCHNHILYLLPSFALTLPSPPHFLLVKNPFFSWQPHGRISCLFHGQRLYWRGKRALVSSYLPLESQRNAGWKGPPEPSPSWKQGCLHRGTWLLRDTSWWGQKPLRMEIHKLSASWGSCALSFSLQAFPPYSLPEFPLIHFLFLLYFLLQFTLLTE